MCKREREREECVFVCVREREVCLCERERGASYPVDQKVTERKGHDHPNDKLQSP